MKRAMSGGGGAGTRREFLRRTSVGVAGVTVGALSVERAAHAAGSDVIRIGVIGCGGRGAGAALNAMTVDPGVRLVAMADLFPERVQEKRDALRAAKPDQVKVEDAMCLSGFDGSRRLIGEVDVVLVACAAKFHPYYLGLGIEAGKHVFVEKPHAIDPAGVKAVRAACELARKKGLSVLSGLQSRYHEGYRETMRRIHDGAIGEIVSIEENFLRAPYGLYERRQGMNEVQFQCGNQYHFTWLSGDDVPQSLIHNVDRSIWAMREQPPVKCHGLGGRSSMFGEIYGDVFDHHSVIYEFANGVKLYAFCRTQTGCYNENSSLLKGTKGSCDLTRCVIRGETEWKWEGAKCNPYDEEHRALFHAIREGKPINSGDHMSRATLVTVMGQISCYSGREVTYAQAEQSDFQYLPRPEDCSFDMKPPVTPGPDGIYPVRVPGVTKIL